jgi:hypothetical protein
MRALLLAAAVAALPAHAQPASPCDQLAGEEQKRCLRLQAERQQEKERLGREEQQAPRSCDRLFGPEKELCLKRGGTVRAREAPRR